MRVFSAIAAGALLAAGLSAQGAPGSSQNAPTQPPQQRPAGATPAGQSPPNPTPKTAPKTAAALPTYEGQTVASVELAGQPGLDAARYLPLLTVRAQQPFSQAAVNQSIAALQKAGAARAVQLELRPETNGLRVLFVLQPAQYFGLYEFPGAQRFSYARLLQVTNYPVQEPYSERDVTRAALALHAYLQREGYFTAKVTTELKTEHGLVTVLFHTTPGKRARFGSVTLIGTNAAETARLNRRLGSLLARLHLAAIRSGKAYSYSTLQNATQYLQSGLDKQHHLAATVALAGAGYEPQTNRANIVFEVTPGPVVEARVTGAHLWPWTRNRLLPIEQQAGVDSETIQEGQQNLVGYFNNKGYFDAQVRVATTGPISTSDQAGAAPAAVVGQNASETITYQVAPGPRHEVQAVTLSGPQPMPRPAELAQLKVAKGHWFSHGDYNDQKVRDSADNLKGLYQAAGYGEVKVTPHITHAGGNIAIDFAIAPGVRDRVGSLTITGNATQPAAQLAPKGINLGVGKPYSQRLLTADRNQILAHYLSLGYLNATFRATAQELPGHPHEMAVTYLIDEGPQVRTATIVTLGRTITQQRLVDRNTAQLQAEKLLTENDLLASESSLYNVGIFDWAEVDPRRPITTQTQEDVIVKVHEAPRNTLIYGVGFDLTNRGGSVPGGTVAVPGLPPVGLPSSFKTSQATFYGPSGNIEYSRLNLAGKADTFSVGAFAGRLDQRGTISLTDPYFRWSGWGANILASAEHNSQNPIFTSREAQLGFQLQRPLNKDKTTNLTLRYSFSETGLTRILIPALVPTQDQNVRLSTFSSSLIRDTRDNPLDAHKGIYESYEVDYNPAVLGSSANFAKLLLQTAYYRKVPLHTIWANSLRLGMEQAIGNTNNGFIPLSEEFFTGGGSTLRGFPLDGAGPQRTIPACGNPSVAATCSLINVPVGGPELIIVNSEFRIPTPMLHPGLGVAAFYDGGNVYDRVGFTRLGANFSHTVGFGLRYATPVGPIRVDFGRNLNAPVGIKPTQIFLTLGQAF